MTVCLSHEGPRDLDGKGKVTIQFRTGKWMPYSTRLDLDVVETSNLIFLVNKVGKPGF